MNTRPIQTGTMVLGALGAAAMSVASWRFFSLAPDIPTLYSATALQARLIAASAADMRVVTWATWGGIVLLLVGCGAWIQQLPRLRLGIRTLLFAGVLIWLSLISALMASIGVVHAALQRATGEGVWHPVLMNQLDYTVLGCVVATVLLWGSVTWWLSSSQSPMPKRWVWGSPGVLMAVLLLVAWTASHVVGHVVPAWYGIAPWLALMLSFLGLTWPHAYEEP